MSPMPGWMRRDGRAWMPGWAPRKGDGSGSPATDGVFTGGSTLGRSSSAPERSSRSARWTRCSRPPRFGNFYSRMGFQLATIEPPGPNPPLPHTITSQLVDNAKLRCYTAFGFGHPSHLAPREPGLCRTTVSPGLSASLGISVRTCGLGRPLHHFARDPYLAFGWSRGRGIRIMLTAGRQERTGLEVESCVGWHYPSLDALNITSA